MTSALVIEDTPEFALQAGSLLASAGFDVHVADDGTTGLSLAAAHDPDLVLLDLNLPDLDGLDVCRRLRGFSTCYVIMVTARTSEADLAVGFAAGADDYVTKPFSAVELRSRIAAMMRRPRQAASTSSLSGLSVEAMTRMVSAGDTDVELTDVEFRMLKSLLAHTGDVVTRDDLAGDVWGAEWDGASHAIDAHLSNLRKKLRTLDWTGGITSVRGVGLRLDPAN